MTADPMIQVMIKELKMLREQVSILSNRSIPKENYTCKEFAALKGLKHKTVRDYCWEGRLQGISRKGRWAIPHAELLRYEKDGLLTPRLRQNV